MSLFQRFATDDVSVVISELLVATADSSDPLLDGSVNEVLAALRKRLGMDVVFVSEFVDGQRVFRFVESAGPGSGGAPAPKAGDCNPVEQSFCQRVVDGRLPGLVQDVAALPPSFGLPPVPFRVGAHLSTPIVLKSGRSFGTLCCYSGAPNPALREKDLETLQLCAQLVARKMEQAGAMGLKEPPPDWSLEPITVYDSPVWKLP